MVQSLKNLISSIFISVSLFIFWNNILPAYNQSNELKVLIEEKAAILDSRNKIAQRVEELEAIYKEKYTDIQRLSLVVPEGKQIPELISTLESIFSRAGIVLESLAISPGTSGGDQLINIIGIESNLETTYQPLLTFLAYLERNIRLIDVNSISIDSEVEFGADQVLNLGILGVNIKANTYYLKSEEELQAAAKASTIIAPSE